MYIYIYRLGVYVKVLLHLDHLTLKLPMTRLIHDRSFDIFVEFSLKNGSVAKVPSFWAQPMVTLQA